MTRNRELITDEVFNDFLCREVANVVKTANGAEAESYMPLLVVMEYAEGDSPPVNVFALAFEDFNQSETRHSAIFELGKRAFHEEMQPIAAFLSSEAWIRMCKSGDHDPNRRVSDYEDKREVLIVVGLTFDGRSNAACFNIERDDQNYIHLGAPTFLPFQREGEASIEPVLLHNFFRGYMTELQATLQSSPSAPLDDDAEN
jgi:hypothetical protein